MAFIRRHRLVLVPLLLAAMVGVGSFFLLRSRSEEPGGNVSPTYSRETVAPWQEDVSKRSQHGREYKFVHTVERVDPETEEVVTDTIVSTVRERGSSLCYQDAEGNWVPTVAEWQEGGLGFTMNRNNWQVDVPLTLGGAYDYTVAGRTLQMRPRWVVLSDGAHTAVLGSIDPNVRGTIDPNHPSRLVFADALGERSAVDIELVVERAALHQNVVLRSKPALPDGFNEKAARLYVYTELSLDLLTADGTVGVKIGDTALDVSANNLETARNTDEAIVFTASVDDGEQTRNVVLHRFVESRVWDSAAAPNETHAARQLWRSPNDLKTYLVESVPYAFLAEATGTVIIDYESRNGDITEDEVWTADATYYISSDVNVGDDVTLTIEPGTVVKFDAGSINVTADGAALVAKGEPYRYIVLTSKEDDNSGEDLTTSSTSGSAGQYDEAINIGADASADCAIELCKIGYATKGIQVDDCDFGTIRHCIIRSCSSRGVYMTGSSIPDVFNNLIVSCGLGIDVFVDDADTPNCTIRNNTIDGGNESIYIYTDTGSPWPSATFVIRNNLVQNYTSMGIVRYPLDWGNSGFTLTNNGFEAMLDEDDPGPWFGTFNTNSNNVDLTVNVYDTTKNQLGAFFIDTTNVPDETDGSNLVNTGYGNAHASDLYGDGTTESNTLFEITAPDVVSSDITATTTWSKRSADGSQSGSSDDVVDIGYHHPRVDKVIDNTAIDIGDDEAVTLTIDPGVVIALKGTESEVRFNSSATANPTLTCDGSAIDEIVMAGKQLVSMNIEANYESGAELALNKPTNATSSASVTHARLIGVCRVNISKDSSDEIKHCVFERGYAGVSFIYTASADRTGSIRNCLFVHNSYAGVELYLSTMNKSRDITLRNCTFDGCTRGVYPAYVALPISGSKTLTVEDCLFTNCDYGVIQVSTSYLTLNEDYNAFWDCGENVYEVNTGSIAIGTNSIVLLADPYDPAWFVDEDPASSDWGAQWYLDQEGACIDGGSDVVQDAEIDLDTFTTSLDGEIDVATVDIGYHYPGPGGLLNVDLEDNADGTTDLTDMIFRETEEIEVNIDVDSTAGWTLYVNDVSKDTGSGDFSNYTLDLNGVTNGDDGTYVVRIDYDDADVEDIIFTFTIDDTNPTVTIDHPDTGESIVGF